MYTLSAPHERRLLWLLMLTQFTLIMDFMAVSYTHLTLPTICSV